MVVNNENWIIVGAIGIGAILMMKSPVKSMQPQQYNYSIIVDNFICKHWSYIESRPYIIVLNSGDSINLTITYNIPSNEVIDLVDIRFHNICSTSEGHGKMYAYVNGNPALPTIGVVNTKSPIYLGFPSCSEYGTVFTTIWDTNDTKGIGTYNYLYTYEGSTPLYVKSLELYVTKG